MQGCEEEESVKEFELIGLQYGVPVEPWVVAGPVWIKIQPKDATQSDVPQAHLKENVIHWDQLKCIISAAVWSQLWMNKSLQNNFLG